MTMSILKRFIYDMISPIAITLNSATRDTVFAGMICYGGDFGETFFAELFDEDTPCAGCFMVVLISFSE